ncbi:MAG TPA: GNAT family N-acetyltransferase [Candidatus Krumholzibacteria bacterium]|nr:GNAT family N-acetyltransferase [Candidatus Krumholzibacteria bacterium]
MSDFRTIRPARVEDAAALSGLLDELGYPATVDVVTDRLAQLARAGETVLVVDRDGELLGFVSVHVTPVLHRPTPVGRMTALMITQRMQGHGLGRELVAAAERFLAHAGCALVEVTSNQKRVGAHAFYQHLGYTMTSHRFYRELTAEEWSA